MTGDAPRPSRAAAWKRACAGDRGVGGTGRAAALLATLLLAGPPALAQESAGGPVAPALAELHDLVNGHRSAVGCGPLRWHPPAASVAVAHSRDMAERAYFDHRSPDGRILMHRLSAAGVRWRGPAAENLALTPAGPASVLELWLDSPGHRRNLEDCRFTHHGLGRHGDLWTQVLLANPRPDAGASGADTVEPRGSGARRTPGADSLLTPASEGERGGSGSASRRS